MKLKNYNKPTIEKIIINVADIISTSFPKLEEDELPGISLPNDGE